jgi:hypothetical protein
MSFVDFAGVRRVAQIEQAAKFLGLKTSEERSQPRAGIRQRRPPGGSLPIAPWSATSKA